MEQPTVIATDTEEMYTPIRVPKDGDIYVAYSTTEGKHEQLTINMPL